MIKYITLLISLVGLNAVLADDPSEKGVPTSPLTVYSGGIGGGAAFSLNDELSRESEQFFKLSFINSMRYKENLNLFMDVDWFIPGNNYGVDFGIDYLLSSSEFSPFLGMGVGAHYFDKEGADFGENVGASATVHLGFLLDLSDALQIRVRVPYHFTANDARDQAIGLDIGFLFSDRFRHIKKLNY
ncbi:hypothetical protein ACFL5V_03710 [Fibrobacterota bacterium]